MPLAARHRRPAVNRDRSTSEPLSGRALQAPDPAARPASRRPIGADRPSGGASKSDLLAGGIRYKLLASPHRIVSRRRRLLLPLTECSNVIYLTSVVEFQIRKIVAIVRYSFTSLSHFK